MKPAVTLPTALADRIRAAAGHGPVLPLALCALALCAAALVVRFAGGSAEAATRRLDQARTLQQRTAAELDAARVLDEHLATALAHYRTLAERGVVGREPDDQWPERVARALAHPGVPASEERQTPRTRFAPAQPLVTPDADGTLAPAAGQAPGLQLMVRRLQIEATLRHEGELLDMLARLEAERSKLVLTRACSMDRLPQTRAGGRAPTLRASCQVDGLAIVPAAEVRP